MSIQAYQNTAKKTESPRQLEYRAFVETTRGRIISLSLFVDRHSSQVMRAGASFDPLIDINRSIMQGLSPATAPAELAPALSP